MNFNDYLKSPGEHALKLPGLAGELESLLSVPNEVRDDCVAILGHPHSLHGGTMQNKVITTLARTFNALRVPSLRFNFRGVGASAGRFDNGVGESDDMLALAKLWEKVYPRARFIFAGFSFGSYVTYRVAARHNHSLLISIAPPVERFDYQEFFPNPNPWIIVQGDQDEVVSSEASFDFADKMEPKLPVLVFEDTGHFFHGKLVELKARLMTEITQRVPFLCP